MARARQAEKGEFYKKSKSVKRYRNTKEVKNAKKASAKRNPQR